MRPALGLTAGIALLSGCSDSFACLQGAYPAIAVHVTAAGEAAPVSGARGEIIDESYRDSLVETGQGRYRAGEERPGTYAVHLERAGYSAWDTTGVFVFETGGDCSNVVTQEIHARLQRIP
jgi:hypothetical protein